MLRDRRGGSFVEYLILVACVALLAIGGWRLFGASAHASAETHGNCIESMSSSCGKSGSTGPGTARSALAVIGTKSDPKFDKIKGGKDAKPEPFKGTPFVAGPGEGEVHPSDISQGQIGDCYLMAAMAAVAVKNPDVIKNAVRDNKDGTYTVTFYEKAPFWKVWDGSYHKVEITVKNEFPSKNGQPVFAQPGDGSGDGREMWPMIIEKAYAQWKGGYNGIGEGGTSDGPMEALTGKPSSMDGGRRYHEWFGWGMEFNSLADAFDKGAVTTGTRDSKDLPLFKNDTLVGNHEYYVTGVDREKKTVTVRNPWGWGRGEVTLSWDDYKKHFISMTSNPTK